MTAHITTPSTTDARAWWRIESQRCGIDWKSLIEAAESALSRLRIQHVGAPSS